MDGVEGEVLANVDVEKDLVSWLVLTLTGLVELESTEMFVTMELFRTTLLELSLPSLTSIAFPAPAINKIIIVATTKTLS